MIITLSLIVGGSTLVVDPTRAPPTRPLKKTPSDIEVQIASAPTGVSLPISVPSVVWIDSSGRVARCRASPQAAVSAFGPLACQQIQGLPRFPVERGENGHAIGASRSIVVSFDTPH